MNIEFILVDITEQDRETIGLGDNITKTKDLQIVRNYLNKVEKKVEIYIDGRKHQVIGDVYSLERFERKLSCCH